MNEQLALLRQDIQTLNATLEEFEPRADAWFEQIDERFDRIEVHLARIETTVDVPPD